jgi:hypothetical protein
MRKVLSKLLYALSFIFGFASLTFSFLIEAGPDIGIRLSYPIHPFLLLLLLVLIAVGCIIFSYRLRVVE